MRKLCLTNWRIGALTVAQLLVRFPGARDYARLPEKCYDLAHPRDFARFGTWNT
jgi:hypothetical protein